MADFSMSGGAYAAIGQGVASAISASFDRKSAKYTAAGQAGVRAANNAANAAWAASNQEITNLQRWTQSVRNSRVYESVGRSQEALATNYNRARDARTSANFAENIRQAEESGRMAASAAASGVTGSVVEVLDNARQVRNQIQDTNRINAESYIKSDYDKAEFEQRWAILDQLDNSLILDTPAKVDYTIDAIRPTQSVGSAFISGMGQKGLQQVALGVGKFFDFGNTGVDGWTALNNSNRNVSD